MAPERDRFLLPKAVETVEFRVPNETIERLLHGSEADPASGTSDSLTKHTSAASGACRL